MIYDISYKTSMGPIPLHIRFNETDRFIKIYDEIRYLQLLNNHVQYVEIRNKIKYLVSEKSGITDSINHNSCKNQN